MLNCVTESMAFSACTYEPVGIQRSLEFHCVVWGLGVWVWLKRYMNAAKGQATRVPVFSPFSLFAFLFPFLHYHTCMFFLIPLARSLRFGSRT